jgi:hypothetical protein
MMEVGSARTKLAFAWYDHIVLINMNALWVTPSMLL